MGDGHGTYLLQKYERLHESGSTSGRPRRLRTAAPSRPCRRVTAKGRQPATRAILMHQNSGRARTHRLVSSEYARRPCDRNLSPCRHAQTPAARTGRRRGPDAVSALCPAPAGTPGTRNNVEPCPARGNAPAIDKRLDCRSSGSGSGERRARPGSWTPNPPLTHGRLSQMGRGRVRGLPGLADPHP